MEHPQLANLTIAQVMDRDGVNQLPVMSNDHLQGMITREDVVSFLRTL
jgi:predicted transcriptional regulator